MINKTRKLKGGWGFMKSFFSSSSKTPEQKKAEVFDALTGLTRGDINDNATLDKLYSSGILTEDKIKNIKDQQKDSVSNPIVNQTSNNPNNPNIRLQGGRRKLKQTKRRRYK